MNQSYKTFIQGAGGKMTYDTYVPKHIITGDTDSAYIDLSVLFDDKAVVDEVVQYADTVEDSINLRFPAYMQAVFNCNDQQAQLIKTQREVLADRGFFSAKKNYMMHVVDKGGIAKDENKIMGLAIRKSDTPEVVRAFLKTMIEMVMAKKTYADIRKFLLDFKERYHSLPLLDIGRPMNLNTLRKYEQRLAATDSMKGIPYHVRAALFYNSECGSNDIKIRAGDKIRLVYIIHPRAKCIALPADADVLPSFLKTLRIDWESQWETVETKIFSYLKPIGYDPESRQISANKNLVVF